MGFEPTYDGFANRCLTTWLPRRYAQSPAGSGNMPQRRRLAKRYRASESRLLASRLARLLTPDVPTSAASTTRTSSP